MIKRLEWYPIAQSLRDFLKTFRYKDGTRLFSYLVDREDLKIRVGTGNTGEYPAICILFGDERQLTKQDAIIGTTIQLWIDIYVKGEASNDIDYDDIGYRQEFQAQQEILKVLRTFQMFLKKNGLIVNIKLLDILSDGDTNLPVSIQNRMVVDMECRQDK